MTDPVPNRNAQPDKHPLLIQRSDQTPTLETILASHVQPDGSCAPRERVDESGRRRSSRRDSLKRRHNLRSKTTSISTENDEQIEIKASDSAASLIPLAVPNLKSHKSARRLFQQDISHLRSQPGPAPTAAPMNPVRLFIASLGNPPPYSSTRHSAGHVLLKSLQFHLSFPHFSKSKPHGNGLTSVGGSVGRPEYTLWQSPSYMNVSGTALLKAYKHHITTNQLSPTDPLPSLIILYDEMETTPSHLKLRRGPTSARGHNGIKSVQQSLTSAGLTEKLGDRFVKIGIGIGRPAGGSRASADVSQYVLGQLTSTERTAIDARVPELLSLLESEMQRMAQA